MSLADVLARELGIERVAVFDRTVSVSTSGTELVEPNPNRIALTIVDLGANIVYVRPHYNASATAGVLLAANGGALSLTYRDDLVLPAARWHAIASAAASDVYVVEIVLQE